MKSEFYRSIRNRNLKIIMGACAFLMIALVFVLKYFSKDPTFPYSNTKFALDNISYQMTMLLVATIVFSAFMHDNEDKHHTIKHSVAFGIKRSTIFIGRFLVQVTIAIVVYLTLVGIYTILSFGLLTHQNADELASLIRVSIGSFTCLLSALAITHFLLMIAENQNTAYLGALTILIFIPLICNLLGQKVEFIRKLSDYFPMNVISTRGPLVYVEGNEVLAVIKSLLIGLIWMVTFLVVGVMKFQKKEVK